jgi:hypothetical protein
MGQTMLGGLLAGALVGVLIGVSVGPLPIWIGVCSGLGFAFGIAMSPSGASRGE